MNDNKRSDKLFRVLHKAGWSIGDTAFAGKNGLTWMVFGTQDGYEILGIDVERVEAWNKACRQAETVGLIDPL